jgi:CheY-like chemotaxis protein
VAPEPIDEDEFAIGEREVMTISVLEIRAIATALAESGVLNQYSLLSKSRWSPGLQVLLVEDNDADAYLIRRALSANPRVCDVVLAQDGEEALDLFDRGRVFPDLAFVDLKMPRKDGLAFLKEIAARPLAHFPCAVLTSSKSSKDALRAKTRGAVEFVTKPKAAPELRSMLDRVIAGVC